MAQPEDMYLDRYEQNYPGGRFYFKSIFSEPEARPLFVEVPPGFIVNQRCGTDGKVEAWRVIKSSDNSRDREVEICKPLSLRDFLALMQFLDGG